LCDVGQVMGRPRVASYCKVRFPRAVFAAAERAVSLKLDALAASFVALWLRQFRHVPRFVMLMLATALCGCSASNVIGLYAADYRDTTANAGDAQLLLNILRAKNNVPIHFYDLAIIHGSIQLTAGAGGSVPFELNNSATPGTIVPAFSAQSAPTFDVSTLDTQDFTKGILYPIDPQIINQLFEQGVDPRIIMLLFFSEYKKLEYGSPMAQIFLNSMACDYSKPLKDGLCLNQVYGYLHEIDTIFRKKRLNVVGAQKAQLQANVYVVLSPIGGPLSGAWNLKDNLTDLRQLDTKKFKLEGNQLFSISEPRLAICYYESDRTLHALFPSPLGDAACNQTEVKVYHPIITSAGLTVRSTYEILQFLGQVLRFQEEKGNNRCLTLTGDTEEERHCDTGEVLFQVNAPVGTPIVGTKYDNRWYAVYDRPCNRIRVEACDYSLQVLAILELLLNANKAAKDIISTPRVQVVP